MTAMLIYITASGEDEAARIGRALVEERLCACANVLASARSIYRWKDKVEDGPEAVLIVKTTAARVAALTERVRQLHGYDLPCVVAVPIVGGNPDFLAWIEAETGGGG